MRHFLSFLVVLASHLGRFDFVATIVVDAAAAAARAAHREKMRAPLFLSEAPLIVFKKITRYWSKTDNFVRKSVRSSVLRCSLPSSFLFQWPAGRPTVRRIDSFSENSRFGSVGSISHDVAPGLVVVVVDIFGNRRGVSSKKTAKTEISYHKRAPPLKSKCQRPNPCCHLCITPPVFDSSCLPTCVVRYTGSSPINYGTMTMIRIID